jgi:hypothetical protein
MTTIKLAQAALALVGDGAGGVGPDRDSAARYDAEAGDELEYLEIAGADPVCSRSHVHLVSPRRAAQPLRDTQR